MLKRWAVLKKKLLNLKLELLNTELEEETLAKKYGVSRYLVARLPMDTGYEWCPKCERKVTLPCVKCNADRWKNKKDEAKE